MKREWLINLRKNKKISQEELAKACQTTQMMISNIEIGLRRPSPELAKRLAEFLNFNWTKFYEDSQEIKEEDG